jgi:hypothetical protein
MSSSRNTKARRGTSRQGQREGGRQRKRRSDEETETERKREVTKNKKLLKNY